jgi:hypothetical protein
MMLLKHSGLRSIPDSPDLSSPSLPLGATSQRLHRFPSNTQPVTGTGICMSLTSGRCERYLRDLSPSHDIAEVRADLPVAGKPRLLVIGSVMLALFLGALDSMIMSAAMPTIVSDLGGLDLYSWVFSSYLLTRAIALPVFGKLCDLYSTKRLYGVAIAIFVTTVCADFGGNPWRRCVGEFCDGELQQVPGCAHGFPAQRGDSPGSLCSPQPKPGCALPASNP